MGFVISVYSTQYYREFVLPPINNADYVLNLHRTFFRLKEDVAVRFEVIDDVWKICPSQDYRIYEKEEIKTSTELLPEDLIRLITVSNEQLAVLFREVDAPFSAYRKYDISGQTRITIGKNERNTICYDYRQMISMEHALMLRKGKDWTLQSTGRNGLYLNGSLLSGTAALRFGDFINIIGLHLVFLGNELAIDTADRHVRVQASLHAKDTRFDRDSLQDTARTEEVYAAPERSAKMIFHRAPRNIEKIDTEPVEIEAPPTLQKTKKQPLLLTIGPSFTMAIPMLLGCLMMIYASRASGMNTGLFMYSGLVMSVSSAVIGVIWALANLRYQKKSEQEDETRRFDAYSRYLVEKTDLIRDKYEKNTSVLRYMYPAASVLAEYRATSAQLWNRNISHEDFLCCRLGIGQLPFQAEIRVPKKKFSLGNDELQEKPAQIRSNFETLYEVPILIDLPHHPLTGIIGGEGKRGAVEVAQLLTAQIAAAHCYTDVKMVFLYDQSSSEDAGRWDFVRWLPHVWSQDRRMRYVASDKNAISDVCYELARIFRQRSEERREREKGGAALPHFVLFLTDAALIEEELIAKYVYDKDENLGLSVLILADTYEHLPNACDYIIQNDERYQGMYNLASVKHERSDIAFDPLDPRRLEAFARALCGVEVQELETGGEIPSTLTFFEMYGVTAPAQLDAAQRWRKNRTYDNIRGLIGEKSGGAPCYMDVHEKFHGPHGLVAGTTGSGKSETLQTYMLSLALNYSPDDVGFFIIDYKGGGMAHLFDGLPHLLGQISNLSGNQIHRAMVSIKSENRRRQRIFNENGVNNINAYTRLVKNKEASEPVPHLFIIIDEFAELKKEEPDFMRELISVAQVGRSLGVHLILATQKPSGTVDDNIWSNSRFRLCLRVQDREDSMDMLHKPDAAYITQAGRCYLQVGSDEVYELFQSGWSGAPYDETAEAGSMEIARLLTLTGRTDIAGSHAKATLKNRTQQTWIETLLFCAQEAACGQDVVSFEEALRSPEEMQRFLRLVFAWLEKSGVDYPDGRYNALRLENLLRLAGKCGTLSPECAGAVMDLAAAAGVKLPTAKDRTQLDAVIEYLAQTARDEGYNAQHQLWLPVLPRELYLDYFTEYKEQAFADGTWKDRTGAWTLETVIGMLDDPKNQAQLPLKISFSEGGHLAVIGSVVSGKSTFVQTLLYAMITSYSPREVNIYGIDFSSKMMSGFEGAPHVGGIAYEGDTARIAKLFHLLEEMLTERKALLRGGNYSQYVQVHGMTLPAVLLVIDNISAFKEKTGEAYESQLITLSREGVSHGIFLVITAGGFGMNELSTRIAENMRTMVSLELPDRYAYADVLHTMKIDVLPEAGVKGRGLALFEGDILEFQTALALSSEDDYQRIEHIAKHCEALREAWRGPCAEQIPQIPEKPVWEDFAALKQVQAAAADPKLLPVGYDEESARIYSMDLSQIFCYLITGAMRTGKRNFMKIMIQAARMKGAKILVLDAGTDMNIFSSCGDVRFLRDADELFAYFGEELTPLFQERNRVKKALEEAGAEEEELFAEAARQQPVFLFIPDLTWLIPLAYSDERGMGPFLENLVQKGRYHNIYFIGILSQEKKADVLGYRLFSDFSGYHCGIHFGGNPAADTLLNFDYLGYAQQSAILRPGIGLLPDVEGQHDAERVVVPLARWKRE